MSFEFSKACVIASALCFFGAVAAQAATINIAREASNPHETVHGMHANTAASGYQIDGASVTATFADASTEDLVWERDPIIYTEAGYGSYHSDKGWANGTNLGLFMSWDGFELETSALLTSLSINLAPGDAVFDTKFIFDNDPSGQSTVGSSFGFEFELYSEYQAMPGTITATYSGIVNILGDAAAGDLFTTLTLDFSGLTGGGLLGNLNFRSDIDAISIAGDLNPAHPAPVPLPASMSFLLLGLAGLTVFGRRTQA